MNSVKYLVGSESINNLPMQPFSTVICDFIAALSEKLIHNSEVKQFPDIIALAFWGRRGNILKLKEQYKGYSDRLGRGMVFHIAPSNVPVNFAFSFLFSLLAGNANMVRVPSKSFVQIRIICDAVSELLAGFPEIRERSAFVTYPADDEITADFCKMADARIIWGGDATVEHIRGFAVKPRCVDVVFPDRYSICIIDGKAIQEASGNEIKRVAGFFYNDTYLMDQNACSSPQIVFWQNADATVKKRFWDALIIIASKKYELQPAVMIDKYVQLCRDMITYNSLSSIRQNGVLYRAVFSVLPAGNLTDLRGRGGYFYEYDLKSLDELAPFITEKYQTVTCYGILPEVIKEFVMRYQLRGIDRIVPIGSAMDIGLIWDGYDLINMLSRQIYAEKDNDR
jgi:hypothetical protein